MIVLSYLILILASIFAIYWSFRIKKVMPMVINFGMVIGVLLVMISALEAFTVGLYIYLGFTTLAFFYGLADKNRKLEERLVICLMSAGIFAYWLWTINHWDGNTLLAPIFVLLVALAGIVTRARLRNESGFLFILAADAISLLLVI